MAIQKINLGTEPHGVGGDSYRTANDKINKNFEEVSTNITNVDEKYSNTEVKITEEVARAKQVEDELKANLEKEASRAVSAEADILGVVESESKARTAENIRINEVQAQLKGLVDSEVDKLKRADTSIKTDLDKTHRYAVMSQTLGLGSKFYGKDGQPLSGGKVYTYEVGTSTLLGTYKDAEFSIPNTNPIILDETGSADVFLKGTYRFRIFDKNDDFIEEQESVSQLFDSASAKILSDKLDALPFEGGVLADTFVAVTANGIGSVPLTLRDMLSDSISPKNFGGKGDGVTDDTQAIKKYIAHLKTKPIASFYLPAGDWFVTETITLDLPNYSTIVFDGVIKSNAKGVPLVILGSYDRNCNGYYFRNVAAYYSDGYANIIDEPTKSSVAVLLMNLVTCYGNIAKANGCYYGVKADATQGNGGTSYNHIYLGTVAENVKSLFLTAQAPDGYCNENTFYGGSLGNYSGFPYTGEEVDITVDHNASGFKLNNNLFFRNSIEANHIDTKAAVINGENNCIFQPRIENSKNYSGFVIELTANSLNCVVSGGGFGLSNATISDLGANNKYETTQTQFYSGDADGDRAVVEAKNNNSSNDLVYSGKAPDGSITYRVRGSGVVESEQYIYAETGLRWSSGDGTRKDRGLFVVAGSPSGVITATTGSLAVDTTLGGLYHKRYGGASGWTKSQEVYSVSTVYRPTTPTDGEMVFDTTLGKPVWWQGSKWVDATGKTV